MTSHGWRGKWAVGAVAGSFILAAVLWVAGRSREPQFRVSIGPAAPGAELREFAIRVDGKLAGRYRMEITGSPGGKLVMKAGAEVKVKHVFGCYVYSYWGKEIYQAGRLWSLVSQANDNGKEFTIRASADG